jgi:hypothetical protein
MPYIAMIGDPYMGFELFGPCASVEAADDAGEWARNKYGSLLGSDWWVFKLNAGIETTLDEMDPTGTVVVFGGSISDGWLFYGPFKDTETAYGCWPYNDGLGADCVIELRPVKEHELETA